MYRIWNSEIRDASDDEKKVCKDVSSEGIKLPNEEEIKKVDLNIGYKYFGAL